MSSSIGRILFFPREPFPTDRVRLNTLFGKVLLGRGHVIDIVMQAKDQSTAPGRVNWSGQNLWIGPAVSRRGVIGRIANMIVGFTHDGRQLLRLARPSHYDCILVSDKYLVGALACAFARVRRMCFVFWLTFPYHEADIVLSRERGLPASLFLAIRGRVAAALLRHAILPHSDHVLVQSERMANIFAEMGVEPARMTPIVTGIDLEGIEPRTRAHQNLMASTITIAYLGTLVRERRLEVLIEMLPILKQRGIHARLLLIGDSAKPEDRRNLEQLASALQVSDLVTITGFLPRRDALNLARTADIGVSPFFPSKVLDVASPTKLIEYLALGLPVVANAHPDQSAVLKACRSGVCVPWGARHFARAITWISRRSEAQLTAMGQRGRDWVLANRSYDRIADDFEVGCKKAAQSRLAR